MRRIKALLFCAYASHVDCFLPTVCREAAANVPTPLFAEEQNEDYRSNVDQMRNILEQSWNETTMSHIPTNAKSGALAGTEAIMNILNDPSCGNAVMMIDIALPSLDPTSPFYDAIGAVEFCVELANGINDLRQNSEHLRNDGKIAIVVKDENLSTRAKKVLDDPLQDDIAEYDDFSDFDLPSIDTASSTSGVPGYRIGSFFGSSEEIPSGRNMMQDICKLVSQNAIPSANAQDEDAIIINCPASQAELIGVRWLISKYGSSKRIIIVNNRLNPLPHELVEAETIYSVLPLIARSVGKKDEENKNPKIVLMRRFPDDWQIHVDASSGLGFELVSSVPAKHVGVRGPSMEFISKRVKEFMIQKFQS